jgi:cupin superfamily acireductone dioxygenase involved in methionine salvage
VGYIGGLTTFRSIVKTTGHGYKKVNNRNILIKSPRLQSLKIKFLQYLQYKEQNALFVVFFF